MIRFIEVTSTQGLKELINTSKIVSINESVNNQHTYVHFNGDDYIKVKETYEEIRQLIKDVNQDNSKNSKVPEMLEMLKKARLEISRLKLSMLVRPDCTKGSEFDDMTTSAQHIEDEIESLIKEVTEL